MPKVKKQLESESGSASDSDSGPEDRTPAKKAKTEEAAGGSSSSGKKNKAGDMQWELEKTKFVTVRSFKGKTYIDIREFYDAGGELKPGKKGISLTPSTWQKLKAITSEIDDAVKDM